MVLNSRIPILVPLRDRQIIPRWSSFMEAVLMPVSSTYRHWLENSPQDNFVDSFEHLHDIAAVHNFRTIALQRRQYPGSTPFTDEELEEIATGSEKYIQKTRKTLIDFIQYVVETLHVPAIQDSQGGLALVGWSMASSVSLTVLAGPEGLSSETNEMLKKNLRSIIIYGMESL